MLPAVALAVGRLTVSSACLFPSSICNVRAVKKRFSLLPAALAVLLALPSFAIAAAPSGYGAVFRWYQRAAEAGDAEAQFMLALQYEQGLRGGGIDLALAEDWYRSAAENGYGLAQLRLALLLQARPDDPAAAAEAVGWLEAAAGQGLADAQFNLAIALETGSGVVVDQAAAIDWYRRAAEQGVPQAWYNLGGLLATGDSAPADDLEAYMWLELAAGADMPGAADLRDRLAQRMTPDMVGEARSMAADRRDGAALAE